MTVTTSTEVMEGLQRIRIRRRLMWAMWLGYLPIGVLISLLGFPRLTWSFAPAWMVLIAISSGFVAFSKCPRCNSLFHMTMLWGNPWAKECIHCGLPVQDGRKT